MHSLFEKSSQIHLCIECGIPHINQQHAEFDKGVLTGGSIGDAISIVSTPHLENLSVSVTRRVFRLLWVHTLCRILAVI